MRKVFTIGSATMDVFVESDAANIVSVSSPDRSSDFMSYPYGSKIDMTSFSTNVGGGGVNTAMNFANLGFDTSAIFKIGDDIYSAGGRIVCAAAGAVQFSDPLAVDDDAAGGFSGTGYKRYEAAEIALSAFAGQCHYRGQCVWNCQVDHTR